MDAMELWELLFRIYVVLLALLVVSYPFQSPTSTARSLTIVTATMIAGMLLLVVVFIRREWDPF